MFLKVLGGSSSIIETCRYPGSIAKFRMLQHDLVAENPELSEMNERSKRGSLDHDGLGSVEYEVDDIEYRPLYTSIRIKLRPPPAKVVRVLVCDEFFNYF